MLFLCLSFAVTSTVVFYFLDDVERDGGSIQSSSTKILTGFVLSQEMSKKAKDHSLIRHSERCTFGIVSHNSKNFTLSISRIIVFDSSLNGLWTLFCCKSAWSASRWRDDFRSSSRAHEHETFRLVSQLHVAIQTLWRQCPSSYVVWTNRWNVRFQRVSPCLFDMRLRFRLRLCFFFLHVQQTLAHNSSQVSPCLRWCFRSQT